MGDPNAMDGRGVTALAAAAGRGDARAVLDLLKAGADPNPPWHPGHPRNDDFAAFPEDHRRHWGFRIPLFAAVESGEPDCVEPLLARGARVLDDSSRTALFHARDERVARMLLEAGFDLDHRDQYGWSALDNAVADGDVPRAKMLLSLGADPRATHDRGYTVFMSAASSMERSVEMMEALIAAGADPKSVSELGYSALHAAVDVNGAEANAEPNVRAILGYLVKLGLDLELRNNRGETPLMRAVHSGTETEVRVLLELGANPKAAAAECAKGSCGPGAGAPLLFSAVGDPGTLAALLAAGADAAAPGPEGISLLEYARGLRRDADKTEPKDPRWREEWKSRLDRSIALLEKGADR